MSIVDKLKHLAVEEDTPPPAVPEVPKIEQSHAPEGAPNNVVAYAVLFQATNPAQCPSLGRLLKTAQKLESAIADRPTRFRAAVATTEVNTEAVLSDISKLREKLADEHKLFETQMASARQVSITDAENKAEQIKQDISKKQDDLQQLLIGIEKKKAQLAQAGSDFEAAYQRRASEIDSLSGELAVLK